MNLKKIFLLPCYYLISCALIPFIVTFFASDKKVSTSEKEEKYISVLNISDNTVENLNMDDYITGVVAAEMPASFEDEALKAQAVAARTYAMYKSSSQDHESDVCTDPKHCQAYLTEEEMRENWGDEYDKYFEKIHSASLSTSGEYLTYDSQPVMAVFHSMGGGKTENSEDVWGQSIPYLVSVSSPGEEVGVNYETTLTVSFDEFKSTILSAHPEAQISSPSDVSEPILTEGNHVKSMIIGGVTLSGTEIRSLFSLRSTMFQISFYENNVTFSVIGYGHGVGMSQYGANAMAKDGKSYREILSHYYSGTTLE
jgi:stage II sporulation protein D